MAHSDAGCGVTKAGRTRLQESDTAEVSAALKHANKRTKGLFLHFFAWTFFMITLQNLRNSSRLHTHAQLTVSMPTEVTLYICLLRMHTRITWTQAIPIDTATDVHQRAFFYFLHQRVTHSWTGLALHPLFFCSLRSQISAAFQIPCDFFSKMCLYDMVFTHTDKYSECLLPIIRIFVRPCRHFGTSKEWVALWTLCVSSSCAKYWRKGKNNSTQSTTNCFWKWW